jgi:hypothetical protein
VHKFYYISYSERGEYKYICEEEGMLILDNNNIEYL